MAKPNYVIDAEQKQEAAFDEHHKGKHRGANALFGPYDCPKCRPSIFAFDKALDRWRQEIDAELEIVNKKGGWT